MSQKYSAQQLKELLDLNEIDKSLEELRIVFPELRLKDVPEYWILRDALSAYNGAVGRIIEEIWRESKYYGK